MIYAIITHLTTNVAHINVAGMTVY